jgi:hypothetical protein
MTLEEKRETTRFVFPLPSTAFTPIPRCLRGRVVFYRLDGPLRSLKTLAPLLFPTLLRTSEIFETDFLSSTPVPCIECARQLPVQLASL